MGGVEDSQWFDKFMDELGSAFTKVDETIQKGIELWTELTRVDDQLTQDLTGQPNSGESGEENSSQYPVAEVKERVPIHLYWSMCLAEVEEKPSQHWAMRVPKLSESFIQEKSGDGDGDEEEEEESTVSEEVSESRLMWNDDYQQMLKLLQTVDTSSEQADNDDGDDEDVDTFSEEDDESWDDDEEEEDDTTTSKSSENMSELNEGDNDSSLKWKGDNQLLKNVDTSSEEDDESLGVHDYDDDVSDKLLLQGFVDVRQEEIGNNTEFSEVETLFPKSDWVYVTRD